jgi:steroid 5-alpha reductase family enzyme
MVLTHLSDLITVGFAAALMVQLVVFIFALTLKRVDLVDVAWGLSFIAIVKALQLFGPSTAPWVLIVDMLVVIWGLRLSWHIYRRFRKSSEQDARYTALMEQWPEKYRGVQIFFKIFLTQALLATIISMPVIIIHLYQPQTTPVAMIGLVVWVIGFIYEVVADRQLAVFLQKPHGKLMQRGLWKYSRHPNYFGEITMWWGISLIACATPLWWVGLIGAATITYLICFVSGIPLAESRAKTKKGWKTYHDKTSVLIPWPPKR